MSIKAHNATKTAVSYCDTAEGTYVALGNIIGEIPLPKSKVEVAKHKVNLVPTPALVFSDPDFEDVTLQVSYQDYATYATLKALEATVQYFKYELENGDWFTFVVGVSSVSPVTGADNGACVGEIVLVVATLHGSGAAVV